MIVNITSRLEYEFLEQKLRKLGYKRNLVNPGPLCRFEYSEFIVDVMPLDESILGFSNPWYRDGFKTAQTLQLDNQNLKILTLPYFLATKLTALKSRAKKNALWESKDFEDVIVVLSGRKNLEADFRKMPEDAKTFISETIIDLMNPPDIFQESAAGCLRDFGDKVAKIKSKSLIVALNTILNS
jgi:hypothetical protein